MMQLNCELIKIDGRYFWKGKDRFVVNGVVYQPIRRQRGPGKTIPDPIVDEEIEELKKDIPLFKELRLNTLYIYCIDNTKSHDEAMKLLAEAGIYVFVVLSAPSKSISRLNPFRSCTQELLNHHFSSIDCMSAYTNTAGLIVSNSVINGHDSVASAGILRAVNRDIKHYMRLQNEVTNQRILPIGISAADVAPYKKLQFEYFTAGNRDETIDFFAFSCYSWAGKASMQISGYNNLVHQFSNSHIPVFISEYGTNISLPEYESGLAARIFQETGAIFSQEMTHVFSGGCVYEYFLHANKYGLIKVEEDGSRTKLQDFKHLKAAIEDSNEAPRTDPEWASSELTVARAPSFPVPSKWWKCTSLIPTSPVDWDEVGKRIDESQYVFVEKYKETQENDLVTLSNPCDTETIREGVRSLTIDETSKLARDW